MAHGSSQGPADWLRRAAKRPRTPTNACERPPPRRGVGRVAAGVAEQACARLVSTSNTGTGLDPTSPSPTNRCPGASCPIHGGSPHPKNPGAFQLRSPQLVVDHSGVESQIERCQPPTPSKRRAQVGQKIAQHRFHRGTVLRGVVVGYSVRLRRRSFDLEARRLHQKTFYGRRAATQHPNCPCDLHQP